VERSPTTMARFRAYIEKAITRITDPFFRLFCRSYGIAITAKDKIPHLRRDNVIVLPAQLFGEEKYECLVAHVLVHEIMHGELRHFERGDLIGAQENWTKWNIACDLEVERRIFTCGLVKGRPSNNPFPGPYYSFGDIAEEIYLEDLSEFRSVADLPIPGKAEGADKEATLIQPPSESAIEVAREAIEEAAGRGDAPAWAESMIRAAQVTMEDPLKGFILMLRSKLAAREKELIISRPNRRLIISGKKFPKTRSRRQPHVVVAVDTSGSMSDGQLSRILGALNSLTRRYKFMMITCDAEVHEIVEEFTPRQVHEFEGRGGTDFTPVFDYLERERVPVSALIFFTDLMGTFPEKPPRYPVIWIYSGRGYSPDVPFGRIVRHPALEV